jgi:hypothetical protein
MEESKAKFLQNKVTESEHDSKRLFNSINDIMHKTKSNPLPYHTSAKDLAENFSDFFTSKVANIRSAFSDDIESAFVYDATGLVETPLVQFDELSLDEVRLILDKSADKSCDLDPIPTSIVKKCLDELCPIIRQIVNLSLQSGQMPDQLKNAIVTPRIKKPSLETELKNYRPVSNLSYLSKVIEAAVGDQLSKHLKKNEIEEKFQSAYKAKHSTETALIAVFDNLCMSLNSGEAVFMSMLDLSAAFDTVDHRILVRRFEQSLGVHGTALKWIQSYLSDRTMQVSISSERANTVHLDCSVPQGSILGPRMYSDYTMPLGQLIRLLLFVFHCYADDTQLLKSTRFTTTHQEAAVHHLELSINSISLWMFHNKLKLNPEKTEFLIIASPRNQHKIEIDSITLGDEVVPRSKTVRNLGVVMDSALCMRSQVNSIRRTCYFYLSWIRKIRKYLTLDSARSIVRALVLSRLDYCNGLLVSLPKCLIHDLDMVLHEAARVVVNQRKDPNISITKILKDLHWLPIQARIKFKIMMLTYKSIHSEAPQYLSDHLTMHSSSHSLRSNDQYMLKVPKSKNKYGDRAFRVAAPKLWNALPLGIRKLPTVPQFKRSLRTHMFITCYGHIIDS